MIDIVEGDFNRFFDVPFNVYPADTPYVSPMQSDLKRFLNTVHNPVFRGTDELAFFTAHQDGVAVGRITAHVHQASNDAHHLKQAYFGYFDCADDAAVARALLQTVENWAQQRGFNELVGNMNLTAMQQIGVVTDQFENPPYTDLQYNPPHIPKLLANCGYEAFFPMTTFESDLTATDTSRLIGPRQQAILSDPDYQFAPVTRSTLSTRLGEVRTLLNAAFANNPMFVPVTEAEFKFQSKEMKWIIDHRISAVLHHKGEAVATIICIPDLNGFLTATDSRLKWSTPWHFIRHLTNRKRAVLIFSAVRPDLHGRGLNPVVLHKVMTAMKKAGYHTLGGTWIGDENPASLRQKEKMGATPLHRLHLFRKTLS